MRTSVLLATLTTAALSSARLVGIAAPSTLAPSSDFTITLITEGYIQSVADVSVAWGYSPPPGYPKTIGSATSSAYLGPSKSNQLTNVTIEATAPQYLESFAEQEVLLGASLFSLYGASGTPTITNFNVTVKVGDTTSEQLVRSADFSWGC